MLATREMVEDQIIWEVNKGNISVRWDCWLASGIIGDKFRGHEDMMVAEIINGECWNEQIIRSNFEGNIAAEILKTPICANTVEDDIMVWTPNTHGRFTMASMYNTIRDSKLSTTANRFIWTKRLPIKVSFFMSNLLRQRVPIDAALNKLGVNGPSCCNCCSQANVEDFEHLFSHGELAAEIWRAFEMPIGINSGDKCWLQRSVAIWEFKMLQGR